ncbi:hypothetical protein MTsPCn9_29830 [Croceitalea sp. MTPC9]|uniref:DUF6252 family protein n=1 Tax=unclassified Croceitalea TaxID=2632280 RepID=UPI002B3F40CD|nr:hypothetical protein MTsPCn6_21830 [Croceitalea sp. MTPC6]GMN18043.1 hypothetical protein MTsPCn9_29830 [Croceitalea sp. MTPC9]
MKKIIPILFSILLFACSSDDDSASTDGDNGELGNSFITAKINGNDFEAVPNDRGVATISAQLVQNEAFFTFTIAGIDLSEDVTQGEAIALSMAGLNFDLIVEDVQINNPITNPLALQFAGGYSSNGAEGENFDFDTDGSSGFVRITAIDKQEQIISGEFEFNVKNSDTGEVLQVTDGVFNNINYVID